MHSNTTTTAELFDHFLLKSKAPLFNIKFSFNSSSVSSKHSNTAGKGALNKLVMHDKLLGDAELMQRVSIDILMLELLLATNNYSTTSTWLNATEFLYYYRHKIRTIKSYSVFRVQPKQLKSVTRAMKVGKEVAYEPHEAEVEEEAAENIEQVFEFFNVRKIVSFSGQSSSNLKAVDTMVYIATNALNTSLTHVTLHRNFNSMNNNNNNNAKYEEEQSLYTALFNSKTIKVLKLYAQSIGSSASKKSTSVADNQQVLKEEDRYKFSNEALDALYNNTTLVKFCTNMVTFKLVSTVIKSSANGMSKIKKLIVHDLDQHTSFMDDEIKGVTTDWDELVQGKVHVYNRQLDQQVQQQLDEKEDSLLNCATAITHIDCALGTSNIKPMKLVEKFSMWFPNLVSLSCEFSAAILASIDTITSSIENCNSTSFANLKEIILCIPFSKTLSDLDAQMIFQALQTNNQLRSQITTIGIKIFAMSSSTLVKSLVKLTSIKHLKLYVDESFITASDMTMIAQEMKQLEVVQFMDCPGLFDDDLVIEKLKPLSQLPNLHTLICPLTIETKCMIELLVTSELVIR